MSSADELARLVSELEQTRHDLLAATERSQIAKKESERLRAQANDIRNEHSRLLADETGRRVQAETQATQLKAEVERERRLRRDAEAAANDAAQEQRRHVEFVQDARRQFESRLTALVGQLRAREEQVHNLEYQVRDRDRERQRADALEQIVAKREASLQSLSAELVSIRREHMELNAQVAALQLRSSTAEAATQLAREQLANFQANANAAASAAAAAAAAAAASPPRREEQSPPPPSIEDDPHVQETARLVTYTREWIKDVVKEFGTLHAEIDHLVQLVSDTGVILDKGSAQAGLDLAAADRRRLQQLRELESSHAQLQMAQLEGILPTATVVRNGLSDVRFQVSRVAAGMRGAGDAVRAIRALADKHCGQIGLPALQQRLQELRGNTGPPPPLPMPGVMQNQLVPPSPRGGGGGAAGANRAAAENSNNDSKNNSGNNTRPQSPAIEQQQQQQQAVVAMQHQLFPTSPVVAFPQQQQQSSGVALEEYLSLQQQLSKAEMAASTDRAKLENEVMAAKLHVQMEKDRGVAERERAVFEAERKFAEERRDLQRKIDEWEMKLIAAERRREDDVRRAEMEGQRAASKAREEMLDEMRALREQCRELDKEQERSAEMIGELNEKLVAAGSKLKAAAQEQQRLRAELQKGAEVSAAVTMELRMAQEVNDELQRELDAKTLELERIQEELASSSSMHGGGGGAGGARYDSSGLAAMTASDGGKNLWAEWKKNATTTATTNSSLTRIAAAAVARKK